MADLGSGKVSSYGLRLWIAWGSLIAIVAAIGLIGIDLYQGHLIQSLRAEVKVAASRESVEFDIAVEATEIIDNIADATAIASVVGALPALAKRGAMKSVIWSAKRLGYKNPRTHVVRSAVYAAPRAAQRSFFATYRYFAFRRGYTTHAAGLMYRRGFIERA